MNGLRAKISRFHVLINQSKATGFPLQVVGIAARTLGSVPYERMAFYGGNDEARETTKSIITLAGNSEKLQQFNTREEALLWLKS